MAKKLIKKGEELVLVIDRPLLDALGIDEQTDLDISAIGDMLTIRPTPGQQEVIKKRQDTLKKSATETMDTYKSVFEKLSKT